MKVPANHATYVTSHNNAVNSFKKWNRLFTYAGILNVLGVIVSILGNHPDFSVSFSFNAFPLFYLWHYNGAAIGEVGTKLLIVGISILTSAVIFGIGILASKANKYFIYTGVVVMGLNMILFIVFTIITVNLNILDVYNGYDSSFYFKIILASLVHLSLLAIAILQLYKYKEVLFLEAHKPVTKVKIDDRAVEILKEEVANHGK
jgi:hypothetical protein